MVHNLLLLFQIKVHINAQSHQKNSGLRQIKQTLKHGRSVVDITRRLGVSTHSLYKWINLQQIPAVQRFKQASQSEERRRLKAELKQVTEESDILKKRLRTSLVGATVTPNLLVQQSNVSTPNKFGVTYIIYISTQKNKNR